MSFHPWQDILRAFQLDEVGPLPCPALPAFPDARRRTCLDCLPLSLT
jgi:hypothetical protein